MTRWGQPCSHHQMRQAKWVFIAVLAASAFAWLIWHPALVSPAPARLQLSEAHASTLAPGVTLRESMETTHSWKVVDFRVDLTQAHLEVGTAPGGATLGALMPAGAVAGVNGAYFEKDFRPHGWLVDRGQELHPRNQTSPHHLFAIKGQQVFGGRWETLDFVPDFAMQNFPLLVENGAARVQPTPRDARFPRTFLCDSGAGLIHLIVVLPTRDRGPTLVETAGLAALPAFGCRSAVNLDGGPSSGYWLNAAAGLPFTPPPVRIGHAVAVVPN